MKGFVRVGSVKDFPHGRGRAVDVDGTRVAIFRLPDRYVALQDACPHMGASLADGTLIGNHVRCHWHGWMFDLDTGQGDMRAWACARVFEVRIRGEDVLVRRPAPAPKKDPAGRDEEWFSWDPDRFLK